MALQTSGTITLEQIYNQWLSSDNSYWIPDGAPLPFAGFCTPAYNLLAYRGTNYYYDGGGGTSAIGTFTTGTITVATFYGLSASPDWNCNCGGDCNNCDG